MVWRADLDETLSGAREIIALLPPVSREALPLSVWAVQAWLRGAGHADLADIEGEPPPLGGDDKSQGRRALR